MYGETPAIEIQQIPPTSAPGLFFIGANCIAFVGDAFFLLLEIENNVPGVDAVSPTIFIRLTDEQAMAFMNSGVAACQITTVPPTPIPGLSVESKCIVALNGQVFQVFDIEDSIDVETLLRLTSCPVINVPFTTM